MPPHEIEFTDKIIPDAYHGTNKEIAEKIRREGFKPSVGEKNYLGDGVYFFEASKEDAYDWAKLRFEPRRIAVVCAMINLGRCLDLHIPEHLNVVKEYASKLQAEVKRRTRSDRKQLVITDALVLNFIASKVPIDTVRAGRLKPIKPRQPKIFAGSHWYVGQQIIICVRNLDNILRIRMA